MKFHAVRKNNQEWILEEVPFLTKLNYGTFGDYDCTTILRYWIYDRTGILFFIRLTVVKALQGELISIVSILFWWFGAFLVGLLLGSL